MDDDDDQDGVEHHNPVEYHNAIEHHNKTAIKPKMLQFQWIKYISTKKDKTLFTAQNSKPNQVKQIASTSLAPQFLVSWISPMLMLKHLLSSPRFSAQLLPIFYDHFISDPEQVWNLTILPFCGLKMRIESQTSAAAKTTTPKATTTTATPTASTITAEVAGIRKATATTKFVTPNAFQRDSQKESCFSQTSTRRHCVTLQPDDLITMNKMMRQARMANSINEFKPYS